MQEFLATLPWPARWALVAGGGLISAFSGALPAKLQAVGLLAGACLATLGIVATLWHWINDRRAKQGKPRLQLGQILIIAGLCGVIISASIALAGAVMYFRGGNNAITKPQKTSEITIKPVVKTHPYDVPKKLALIDDVIVPIIRDGGDIQRHVQEGRQILNNWKKAVEINRPVFLAHLQDYDRMQSDLLNRVAKIQQANSHFGDIAGLLEIPNSPTNHKETITMGFTSFKGAIGALGDPPYKMDLNYFLTPTLQHFSSGLANWESWRKQAQKEFTQLRMQVASGEA